MGVGSQTKQAVKKRGSISKPQTLEFVVNVQNWLPQTVIVISVIAASIIYLWPSAIEFPMDDTYIHFVYVKNLSEKGGLFFNSAEEIGVGTSSILWVLMLVAGNWFNLSMHWVAKVAGITTLTAMGIGLYHLLRPFISSWVSLAISLLVVLSGHILWFALSGMETMLFLALGILALLSYREERWVLLGILLGLLALTRLEGIILALVIGIFDVWRQRNLRRGIWVAVLICGLICCPWILYLRLRTGYFLPTSGIGRHYSNTFAIQIATGNIDSLTWLSRFPALAYPLIWIGYSLEFVLGGYSLPAPYIFINPGLGSFSYRVSIWAILGWVIVVIPLLWISFRHLVIFLRTKGWEKDSARLPLIILLAWTVLHNLCYMFYLPIIGAASRYASLNHIVLWLALGMAIWFSRQSRKRFWLAAGLTTIALVNSVYWNQVYDSNLDHMLNVRIPAAKYIREQIPENEICAAADIGALRFTSQRPIVDLGGLIDPDLNQWYQADKLDQYLINNDVSCLAIPGLGGAGEGGVFNIGKELGLSQSSLFDLNQVREFNIDYQRWLFGYLPTMNYQATVAIYKLVE